MVLGCGVMCGPRVHHGERFGGLDVGGGGLVLALYLFLSLLGDLANSCLLLIQLLLSLFDGIDVLRAGPPLAG